MADYDEDAARELELFVENDYDLYQRQFKPIVANLVKKKLAGNYNSSKAPRIFEYLMESGAKKYAKEFSIGSDWAQTFSPATRRAVAKRFAENFDVEWGLTKSGSGYIDTVCEIAKKSPTFRKRAIGQGLPVEKCGFMSVVKKGGKI